MSSAEYKTSFKARGTRQVQHARKVETEAQPDSRRLTHTPLLPSERRRAKPCRRGVRRKRGKFVVCVGPRGEKQTLGCFDTEEEANEEVKFYEACMAGLHNPSRTRKVNRCPHGRINRSECRECAGGQGSAFCIHDRLKKTCKSCGQKYFCKHGRRMAKNQCCKNMSAGGVIDCFESDCIDLLNFDSIFA